MSKRRKIGIDFTNFADYAERLEKLGGSLEQTVETALIKSKELVLDSLHDAMKRHNRSGRTEEAILDDARVVWSGGEASIDIGFDIAHGGLSSVFLMYGTTVNGTPRTPKDQVLYDAVYGAATQRKIKKLQEDIFKEAVSKLMGE